MYSNNDAAHNYCCPPTRAQTAEVLHGSRSGRSPQSEFHTTGANAPNRHVHEAVHMRARTRHRKSTGGIGPSERKLKEMNLGVTPTLYTTILFLFHGLLQLEWRMRAGECGLVAGSIKFAAAASQKFAFIFRLSVCSSIFFFFSLICAADRVMAVV